MAAEIMRSSSTKVIGNGRPARLHRSLTVERSTKRSSESSFDSTDSLSLRQHTDSGFLDPCTPPGERNSMIAGGECPKHPQERLKYFCQLHDELVCADCLAMETRHQGHRHFRAEDVAEEYRNNLMAQLQPLREMMGDSQNALKSMDARRKELSQNHEQVNECIEQTFDRLHALLDSRKEELLQESEKASNQKLKLHEGHQAYIVGIHTEIASVVDSVDQTASDPASDVLCNHKRLCDWMLEMTRKFQALPKEAFLPLQGANLGFTYSNKLLSLCQTFGSINENEADPSRCFIDDSTIKGLTVGQEAVVHLLVHNRSGEEYREHIKGLKVDVVSMESNSSLEVELEKDNTESNIYQIKFTPLHASLHQIKVKIYNTGIHNSPYTASVSSVILGTSSGEIKGVLQPYGLTATSTDDIVVVENGKDCVSLFRPDGKSLRTIQGKGNKKFVRPRGVTITKSGLILITDEDGLKHFTMEGKHITQIGKMGSGPLEFNFPSGLANSPDGKIYICDTFNKRLQILNSDLTFHGFLSEPNPPAKLSSPYDVAFNSCGKFYVADYSDHCIKVFSEEGLYVKSFNEKGGNGTLKHPVSVHVNSNDHVFVGEEKASGISVFDQHGKFLRTIPARLTGAFGICTDSTGQLYVTDRSNRRVQIFQ